MVSLSPAEARDARFDLQLLLLALYEGLFFESFSKSERFAKRTAEKGRYKQITAMDFKSGSKPAFGEGLGEYDI